MLKLRFVPLSLFFNGNFLKFNTFIRLLNILVALSSLWERRAGNVRVVFCTVFEVWLAEVQVLAGAGWAVLSAQRETDALQLLSKWVKRAEDLLHAFIANCELCASSVRCRHVGVKLRQHLAGIDGAFGFGTPQDWQWLNDLAWWALTCTESWWMSGEAERRNTQKIREVLTGGPGGPWTPFSPFGPAPPWKPK